MATYQVTAPDGAKYKITAPEGATEEQALDHFKANWQAPQAETPQAETPQAPESSLLDKANEFRKGLGNIAAGEIRGAIQPLAMVAERVAPEATKKAEAYVNEKLSNYGLNPESTAYKGANIVGEALITAPVGGVLAKGAEALKFAPRLVNALRTSGFSTGEAKGILKNIATRAAAGAVTGGVSTAVVHPEDYQKGAILGAALPSILNPLGKLGGVILDVGNRAKVNAGAIARTAAEEALLRQPSKFREQLLNAPENLTAAQAAYGQNVPAFMAMEKEARTINEMPFAAKDVASQAENRRILKEITPNLEQAQTEATKVEALRLAELTRQHNVEAAKQAAERSAFEQTIANPSPTMTGEAITSRKAALEREARNAVKPIYEEAYQKADAPFSLKPIEDVTKDIKGDIASLIDPNVAPDVIDKAQKLFGSTTSGAIAPGFNLISGATSGAKGVTTAATGTLADVHELRSAVNSALSAIKGAPEHAKTTANLLKLKAGIDEAINKGVPEDALSKYKEANSTFKSTVVEPYLKGEVSKLTRLNSVGTPLLASSKVATKFLSSPTEARQFVTAFKNDPEAIKNLQQGIEGIFYNQVVKGSKSVEKFMNENAHSLAELDSAGMGLRDRLAQLGGGVEQLKGKDVTLSEAGKLIPEIVTTEARGAPSAANQARILREYSDILHPNITQERATPFLTAMASGKKDILKRVTGQEGEDLGAYLTGANQLEGLGTIESKLLRNAELERQMGVGSGALAEAIRRNTFMGKLPSYLNTETSTINMLLGRLEKALNRKTYETMAKGMESGKNAVEMLDYLPFSERNKAAKIIAETAPTAARAATLALANQLRNNKE